MNEQQLQFLISDLFLKNDQLWHFSGKDVTEFAREAVEIAKKEGFITKEKSVSKSNFCDHGFYEGNCSVLKCRHSPEHPLYKPQPY